MNKKIAFDNRLCYERDVLRQHAIHHRKLQTILPTCHSPSKVYLDSNEPVRQPHLVANRKRQQLEKERQTEIYAQNQRLAAKMEHILNRQENVVLAAGTPGAAVPFSPRGERSPKKPILKPVHSPAHVHMPGIRLDASQTPMVDCYLSPEYAMGRGNACKKTTLINRGVQRQRQLRIEDENRRLQERLKTQKPYYNTKKWDADWQQVGTKFQHLHQNATVGHILPKTSHGLTPEVPRRPLAARRTKTRGGLPSIKPKTSHGAVHAKPLPHSRGGRLQQQLEAKTAEPRQKEGTVDLLTIHHDEQDDIDDDEPEIIEWGGFPLLEATTRKGVEIAVIELQIEMRDHASGSVQPGDRGLVVRGHWREDVEAECPINLEILTKVAQEIDDLEMMIKLETVSTLSGMGNFPRLSSLLTEEELQRLLLTLVQGLTVQLVENETQLIITSWLLRSPSPTMRDDKARPACRPRTCPSSLPSKPPVVYEFEEPVDDSETISSLDVADDETAQYHRVLCKQLAALLNDGERRIGFRQSSKMGYLLVQYWFHALDAELHLTLYSLRQEAESYSNAVPLDNEQVVAMLDQIQQYGVSPVEAIRKFVRAWLSSSVARE